MRAPGTASGLTGTSHAVAMPPSAASTDTPSTTICQGGMLPAPTPAGATSPAIARNPCGKAVPSTSAPISTPITAPRRCRYQLAAIFIPTG